MRTKEARSWTKPHNSSAVAAPSPGSDLRANRCRPLPACGRGQAAAAGEAIGKAGDCARNGDSDLNAVPSRSIVMMRMLEEMRHELRSGNAGSLLEPARRCG